MLKEKVVDKWFYFTQKKKKVVLRLGERFYKYIDEVENDYQDTQINCQKSINLVSFIPLKLFLLESL